MSVNVQNISVVMMNNSFNPSWFLHATAGDLYLDGSTLHSLKTLVVTAALSDTRVWTFFFKTVFNQLYFHLLFFFFIHCPVEILPTLCFIIV